MGTNTNIFNLFEALNWEKFSKIICVEQDVLIVITVRLE